MSERNETTLFVASPDGKAMEPLPRSELLRRLQARLLRWSQQVWCPEDQKWRPAREIPRLASPSTDSVAVPAPKPAPVPAPRAVAVKRPSVVQPAAKAAPSPTPVAKPASSPSASASTPSARTPSVVRTPSAVRVPSVVRAPSVVRVPSAADADPVVLPWYRRSSLLYGAGCVFIVLALVGMNWLGAAVPARRAVADAGLAGKASVRAHCAWYVQPGSLILVFEQLPADLPPESLFDLLTALAVRNTYSTLFGMKYDDVVLVRDGQPRYRLRGDAWEALAKMKGEPAGRRAMVLVNYLYDPAGRPLLDQKEDRMEYLQGQKEKVLRAFLATFVRIEDPAKPAAPPAPAAP